MIRNIVAAILAAFACPALACSCIEDVRTLQQKIDAADQVLVVRVVGAVLTSDPAPPGAMSSERHKGGRITYAVRLIESFKGSGDDLPAFTGSADVWSGGCNQSLRLAEDLLVFLEPGDDVMHASHCNRSMVRLERYPESEPTLQAIRDYVATGAPIHACDNDLFPYPEPDESCEARRDGLLAPHHRRLRETRQRARSD